MSELTRQGRELLAGITPGPWEHRIKPTDDSDATHAEYLAGCLINTGEPLHVLVAPTTDPDFDYVVPAITGDGPTSARNAEFIAQAPELVEKLLGIAERFEHLADRWEAFGHPRAIEIRRTLRGPES